MGATGPGLLILLADAPGGGWPGAPTDWIVPLATFVLGAALARRWNREESAGPTAAERGLSIPRYASSIPALEAELDRTRRTERSLAVLVVTMDPGSVAELEKDLRAADGTKQGGTLARCTTHTVFAVVGAILDSALREVDLATSDPVGRRYIVALPEATRAQAGETARRVTQRVLDETGMRIRTGVAEFRTDGEVLEDLVRTATGACERAGGKDAAAHRQRALSRG